MHHHPCNEYHTIFSPPPRTFNNWKKRPRNRLTPHFLHEKYINFTLMSQYTSFKFVFQSILIKNQFDIRWLSTLKDSFNCPDSAVITGINFTHPFQYLYLSFCWNCMECITQTKILQLLTLVQHLSTERQSVK